MNQRASLCVLAAAFLLTACPSAYGYIDGGTGSMLLQAALSGVLGALFLAKSYWRGLFQSRKRAPKPALEVVSNEERQAA